MAGVLVGIAHELQRNRRPPGSITMAFDILKYAILDGDVVGVLSNPWDIVFIPHRNSTVHRPSKRHPAGTLDCEPIDRHVVLPANFHCRDLPSPRKHNNPLSNQCLVTERVHALCICPRRYPNLPAGGETIHCILNRSVRRTPGIPRIPVTPRGADVLRCH